MRSIGISKKGIRTRLLWGGIILTAVLLFFRYENCHLVVTSFEYRHEAIGDSLDGYRIIQISDLHNAEFGKDNRKLIEKIAGLDPDMIVITGDIVDSNHTDLDVAVGFINDMSRLCPVYYVTGNHEYWLNDYDRQMLFEEMEKSGAVILSNEAVTITVSEEAFDLIGLDDKNLADDTLKNLLSECSSDTLKIVLAHEPQYISRYSSADVDLVLCGHAHGGQFILPFVGAVVAPNQGLFPEYTSGPYYINDTAMFVSRGLGNSIIPVRLFNKPEIVCIDLISE